jgi:hypothetical protein
MQWAVMAQTAIGVVLAVAAIAKLWGKASTAAFLEAMSVPRLIAAPVGFALPLVEGALGTLLVLRIGGGAAVLAAAALTTGFALTLAVAYLRGVTTGCRCFGSLDSERLTPIAVARAVVLAVAAWALVAWGDASVPMDVTAWLGALAAVVYLAAFTVAGQVYEFERGRSRVIAQLHARKNVATAEELGP